MALSALSEGVVASSVGGWAVDASEAQEHGPDLGVTIIRSGHDPRVMIIPGGTVTISIGVNNLRGDADAHSCVLTVRLPDGLRLKQARPAPSKTETGKGGVSLTWGLGIIPAGAFPRLFELDLTTAGNIQADTRLPVSATVTASDKNVEPENNTWAFVFRVTPAAAHLAVESTLETVPLTIGGPVKFTAEVSNWGTVSASGSALTLTLPPKVSLQSSDPAPTGTSANIVKWQLGDIEPAGSRGVTVTIALDMSLAASIGDTTPESLLKFVFDASTTSTVVNPENNHLEIDKQVDLAGFDLQTWLGVEGTEPGELSAGKDVTYAITYGNFGNALASKASVSLSLGEGLNFVSAEPAPTRSGKSDRFGGGVLTWDVGDLRVGQSSLIKCRVHVASVPYYGSLAMATVSAPGTDINPANNSAFFYAYPPLTAEGGSLGKSLGGTQAQRSGIFRRWFLLLVFLAAVGFVLWKMRRLRVP